MAWPIQLCDVALFVAVAAALRRRLPPLLAAVFAALVLLEPVLIGMPWMAPADIPMTPKRNPGARITSYNVCYTKL